MRGVLSGWWRLWIVLVVCSAVFSLWQAFSAGFDIEREERRRSMCLPFILQVDQAQRVIGYRPPPVSKPKSEVGAGPQQLDRYLSRQKARDPLDVILDQMAREPQPITQTYNVYSCYSLGLLGNALMMVLAVALATLAFAKIARWVVAGFKNSDA